MNSKKGFSLLELILVLSIAASVSFMKFQDLKKDQENVIADAVGQQIKQVGDAVNGYINIHYDKLSTLTSVSTGTGTGTDPGPRTCSTANNTCTITYQTLINDGLLPASFNGTNANKSSYSIVLKRQGTSPNFIINGLVATNNSWTEGTDIRYDLLGKAMQSAGVDSGMSKTATTVSGYSGSWSEQSSDFSNINKAGILGYRVGYDSAMYSVFLRRDGTLPMTGDLNMGAQNIKNAKNITASGTGNFGGNIATNGLDPNDIPANWGGGVRAFDVIASGTVALIKSGTSASTGNLAAYMNLNGDIYASNSVNSSGTVTAGGRVTGGDIYSNSETYTNNWFRTMGDGGIYFQKYGGGWYMADTNTITAYGNKNISTANGVYGGYLHSSGNIDAAGTVNAQYVWASGNVNSNFIHSNGDITADHRLNAAEYVYVNGVAYVGNGCTPNGLMGRTVSGQIVSCVNGIWRNPVSTNIYYNSAQSSAFRFPSATAYCNGNDIAIGGGGSCTAPSGFIWVTRTYPVGTNGWFVGCDQNSDDPVSYVNTYVKCQASN